MALIYSSRFLPAPEAPLKLRFGASGMQPAKWMSGKLQMLQLLCTKDKCTAYGNRPAAVGKSCSRLLEVLNEIQTLTKERCSVATGGLCFTHTHWHLYLRWFLTI